MRLACANCGGRTLVWDIEVAYGTTHRPSTHRPSIRYNDHTHTHSACKIGRGGKVVDDKALEGLRVLLASDAELRAENDITEAIIQTPMFLTLDEFQDSVFARVRRAAARRGCWCCDTAPGQRPSCWL